MASQAGSLSSNAPQRARLSVRPEPVCSVLLAVAIIALIEYAARNAWVSKLVLAPPSAVWAVLVDGFASGFFTEHLLSSSISLALGFAMATAIAITTAGVLASSPFLERVLTPFIVAFQSMPKVAIAPLVVLALGFGEISKITIVAIVCFFPIMVNTMQGLKIRDRDHHELLMSLGANKWQLFYRLRLPHAIPYVFAGLHIGAIFALIGTVVAEFVGTTSGLGYALLQAKAQFDVAGVYACLVLLMIVGLTLHFVMAGIERRVSYRMNDLSHMI